MKKSLLPIWIVLCVVFCSCKDNVVCPAFQSTYILDDSARWARYSLFENDSTPKFTASSRKTKYGVNKKIHFFRKNYELMTAPKVNVLAPVREDSLYAGDEGDFLVSDFADTDSVAVDSLGIDSVAIAPAFAKADTKKEGPRYKYRYRVDDAFNQEQAYYNKYYGELFKDTRPLPPTPEELEELRRAEEEAMGLDSLDAGGGKKGLFGRKRKNNEEPLEEEDESVLDEETLQEAEEIIEETDEPETEANEERNEDEE